MEFDLVLAGGTVVDAQQSRRADVGVREGKIACVAPGLSGRRVIDASGKLVLPGGIDSHCHVEQLSSAGQMCADDFYSASVAAAMGGTTTIMPFAAQHRGDSITAVVDDYFARAATKAVVDYAFHLIVSDPTPQALQTELPLMAARGISSFKVYMTYELLRLSDEQMLEVLMAADREGALLMVHAENHDIIKWITRRLLERGHTSPRFHANSHHPIAESEATHRIISLSRLLDVPALIVHVSGIEAVNTIRDAQRLGARVFAETCPQYLLLSAKDADRPGLEGAKWCCSPPPRDAQSHEAVWAGLKDGTLQLFSSDHAPYRFDESGKLPRGQATTFKEMANGVPGLQVRMPLLFSEGVRKGRISVNEFVALTSTNHARMYGLAHRKGSMDVGCDADILVWDADRQVTLSASMMKDNAGYTPYEGRQVSGWPERVLLRGKLIVEGDRLLAQPGSGEFIACGTPAPVASPAQRASDGPSGVFRKLIGAESRQPNDHHPAQESSET